MNQYTDSELQLKEVVVRQQCLFYITDYIFNSFIAHVCAVLWCSVKIYIEDRQISGIYIMQRLLPSTTFGQLKRMVSCTVLV